MADPTTGDHVTHNKQRRDSPTATRDCDPTTTKQRQLKETPTSPTLPTNRAEYAAPNEKETHSYDEDDPGFQISVIDEVGKTRILENA